MSMTDTEAMTALINQFNQSSAQVMDVKTTTFELHLNKQAETAETNSARPQPAVTDSAVPVVKPTTEVATQSGTTMVTAPLVGVAYLAVDPKQAPFVQVGDRVKSGETLCVIEAMKMINEVPSPVSGIVKEVLIKNATMVEFDEPLFAIEETTV
ncbi:acetyl-CoA carboxylase biotin carboxyl carrier protein [Lactiplantibacillus plantarum]|uniref:acetyl-CoA carboxylase biotin carboxyl carrier protein n=1 Tax=Lactiplantibacillus plantarum TaxID=1590 RepID=UPI003F538DEF